MLTKKDILSLFQKEPDKYWAVALFKREGHERKKCGNCGKFFWTLDKERKTCPDPPCEEYGFIGTKKKDWDYTEVWRQVAKFYESKGHKVVPRYPVICRWRPDLFFTNASIIPFQRLDGTKVTFALPADPLMVGQPCLRFNDIPNIGVTGRHHSSFIMVGQHSMNYWKDEAMDIIYDLCTKPLGIKPEDLVFVEDAWEGGGAFGYSLEYYVKGLEIGNTVFTEFREANGKPERLDKRIVDMGGGFDRWVWYLSGAKTSYESAFGPVVKKLKKGIEYDEDLFERYAKVAGGLNYEDVNIKEARKKIAKRLSISEEELKKIGALQAVYAIADHTKSLLIALTDGGIPSNTGGGFNLRLILRRALSLAEEHGVNTDLTKVMEWHQDFLKKMHPELKVDARIQEIIYYETKKFAETRGQIRKRMDTVLKERLTAERLVELYDSEGITPELIEKSAEKKGMKVEIPQDFYARVAERHMQAKEDKKPMADAPPTEVLWYGDAYEFNARVLQSKDNWVVLDRTAFYPEMGGQKYDTGFLVFDGKKIRVLEVQKHDNVVFHLVDGTVPVGKNVSGIVDNERRVQLTQHHDATHIINGAARRTLGSHVWQHSAYKDVDHARLDITHYKELTEKEVENIEKIANAVVKKNIKIKKSVKPRLEAERLHGFQIYQGGVPSGDLRIVDIEGHDVEACGGTHADKTSSVGRIIITGSEKIQDGVVRLHFVAGAAAEGYESKCEVAAEEARRILGAGAQKNLEKLIEKRKALYKEVEKLREGIAKARARSATFESVGKIKFLARRIENADMKELQKVSLELSKEDTVIFLFGSVGDAGYVFASAGEKAGKDAGKILKDLMTKMGGRGGGSEKLAQGRMPADKIEEAMQWLKQKIR